MNIFDPRGSNRALARRVARWLRSAATMLLPLALHATPALAGAIVVGRGPDCTVPTIREAIQRANGFGGYNLILVTDEVPDGVHHENLLLQNLSEDLVLELVGGYSDCTTLTPTAFGKASLYGGDFNRPTLRLRGHNVTTFRNFWMQSGTGEGDYGGGGIDFQGYGSLVLENVRVAESNALGNYGAGVRVDGQNGAALLRFDGHVEVTDQVMHGFDGGGVRVEGTSLLLVRGDGNSIRNNYRNGISLVAPAVADIGATGAVLAGNGGTGLKVNGSFASTGALVRLYSTVPDNPLSIAGNEGGAIALFGSATQSPSRICTRNVLVLGNHGSPVRTYGNQAFLDVNPENNDTCQFPATAAFACAAGGLCNRFLSNVAAVDTPLIAAERGSSITLNRTLLDLNQATSLLSTNLGVDASTASITLTNGLVLHNTLRDNLFEALNDGIVDIRDTTVALNDGGFSVSLVGSDPTLFQLTNSIIDQPQGLAYLSNGPVETTHFNRVLARNRSGAAATDDILVGQPTYRDAYMRLAPDSPGVDYAPAGGGTDFDGNPRDVDTVNRPDWQGPRDLGAFESQVTLLDVVFADGFEARAPARTRAAGG